MNKKVLIAEDENIIAMDIKRILEKEGYEVVSIAVSALDLIEQAEKFKPHIILIDIMLQGSLDGAEAAKIISYKLQVPIIFITALRNINKAKSINLPLPSAHIIKPFDEKELINTINSFFEKISV